MSITVAQMGRGREDSVNATAVQQPQDVNDTGPTCDGRYEMEVTINLNVMQVKMNYAPNDMCTVV